MTHARTSIEHRPTQGTQYPRSTKPPQGVRPSTSPLTPNYQPNAVAGDSDDRHGSLSTLALTPFSGGLSPIPRASVQYRARLSRSCPCQTLSNFECLSTYVPRACSAILGCRLVSGISVLKELMIVKYFIHDSLRLRGIRRTEVYQTPQTEGLSKTL